MVIFAVSRVRSNLILQQQLVQIFSVITNARLSILKFGIYEYIQVWNIYTEFGIYIFIFKFGIDFAAVRESSVKMKDLIQTKCQYRIQETVKT